MRSALLRLWPALIYAQNATPKFAALHSFSGENGDGAYPRGALLIGANGALYGTTARGGIESGISGAGMVFELTPPSSPGGAWTETAIHTFASGSDGVQPNCGFVAGPDGSYYSTTYGGGGGAGCLGYGGCGTVYELTPPAAAGGACTETILCRFDGYTYGAGPTAPVARAASTRRTIRSSAPCRNARCSRTAST
ncbi:MAG: choice-of-anchor tandem repeat GloVer-containing protein [Bryobacteraceae bacterium]